MRFLEVCRALRDAGYELRSAQAGELVLCAFVHQGAAVTVAMRELTFASGSRWLGLSAPICPVQRVRPRAALLANQELPVGMLAVFQNRLLLRQTLPLDALSPGSLEQTLRALVDTAGELTRAQSAAPQPETVVPYGYLFR